MKQLFAIMLLACSAMNNYAEDSQAAFDRNFLTGPEYMPEVMDPVTAPFDVNGISRPVFAERTTTVKMNKRGLSTRQIQTAIDRMSRQGGGTIVIPDGQWTSERIELTPEFKNIYIKDFTVDGCQRLIDVKALPERPLTNVLIENFEGHGIDFLRLQDVSGFVMKGGKIHTAAPSAVLDGCQSVMLLDMDFNGKQLKQITNNATLYVTQSCLSSKSFLTME